MGSQRKARGNRRSHAQRRALCAEQARSGLSVKAFCAQRSIGYSTFTRWKSLMLVDEEAASQATRFIELSPPQSSSSVAWDVELTLGADIVLRLARR